VSDFLNLRIKYALQHNQLNTSSNFPKFNYKSGKKGIESFVVQIFSKPIINSMQLKRGCFHGGIMGSIPFHKLLGSEWSEECNDFIIFFFLSILLLN